MRESELFDAQWYRREYPDVALTGLDPVDHYLALGAELRRDPGPMFSTRFYLEHYADIAASGLNPLLHYLQHGAREGRICCPAILPRGAQPVPGGRREAPATARIKPMARHPGRRASMPGRTTVLVCAHFASAQQFGSERSLLDVLDGFAEAGFNVVVTAPVSNQGYRDALAARATDVITFDYGWWSEGVAVDEHAVATFAQLIAGFGVDAAHVNTIMLREPLIAARRMGVPCAVHVRELITHDRELVEWIGEPAEAIVTQVLAAADHVIANSAATARCFDKPGATHCLPNTLDLAHFEVGPPTGGDCVRIALVSSNLPKKGLHDFVRLSVLLAQDCPQARLLLVGPENKHTQAIQREQHAGQLPDNLEIVGYLDDPADAMRRADIVLNLSHFQESFGRTVLEAMAASRPVVAYDWGAIPELVEDGVTGYLVPYRDVDAVATRLRQLVADPDKRQAMARSARARAEKDFGKDQYAAKLKGIYADVLARQPAACGQPLTLPARAALPGSAATSAPRIAYFLWHFPVPSETFVLNELRILVAQGYDVEVYCHQSPHPDFRPDFNIRWTAVADAPALARALQETGRTIVHAHFTYPTVTDMVWPACEEAGIAFTFIAHAQDIFRYANDEKNRIGEIGRSPRCLRVLVPSRFHRDYLLDRGVPHHKLLINPNGIDPDLYRRAWVSDRAQRTARSVCAVHRYTAKKGLEQLIRAAPVLAADGISLHLYGYGPLEDEYRRLIVDLDAGNVHLHGPVQGRDELLAVFARHDLFACPSVRAEDGDMDGIPTVLMEAMASGLPVLATGISGIPDLVLDNVTGLLSEAEPGALAASIRAYYALDTAKVEALIEHAAARVAQDYNVERLTAALVRLWRGDTIDIMIVSWNNLAQLREVVRRIFAYTIAPFHLVICDNGSGPDVLAFLCELYAAHDNVTVVLNRVNAKVGPGTNICLGQGTSDYAVYVCGKEGFVLDFGWERTLIDYMDAHPGVGLAGTLCHSPAYLYGRQFPEGIALFAQFRNQDFAGDNPDRAFAHVQGGFFVMRRAMYDQIGGFSDAVPHNYTDVEYSYYAESRGWTLGSAPGLLSLYNKTRPDIFSRVDESVAVIHPPTLDDLGRLDRISRRGARQCNVCGWFQPGQSWRGASCPDCGSLPEDRSLMRWLAESVLTYRKLHAVGVGLGDALLPFWREQFIGETYPAQGFDERLSADGTLPFMASTLHVVYIDLQRARGSDGTAAIGEALRLLRHGGTLVLRGGDHAPGAVLPVRLEGNGFCLAGRSLYASAVLRYDSHPLWAWQRSAACVS